MKHEELEAVARTGLLVAVRAWVEADVALKLYEAGQSIFADVFHDEGCEDPSCQRCALEARAHETRLALEVAAYDVAGVSWDATRAQAQRLSQEQEDLFDRVLERQFDTEVCSEPCAPPSSSS